MYRDCVFLSDAPAYTSTSPPVAEYEHSCGVAGCVDRIRPTEDTRLEQLQVVNFDHEAHTIYVEIIEGDETVYDDTIDVPAADEESTEWGDGGWGEGVFADYPTEPGAYTIHTWRSDQSREDRRTLDLGEYDFECAELMIQIGDPDREDIESELSIWRTFDCRNDD